ADVGFSEVDALAIGFGQVEGTALFSVKREHQAGNAVRIGVAGSSEDPRVREGAPVFHHTVITAAVLPAAAGIERKGGAERAVKPRDRAGILRPFEDTEGAAEGAEPVGAPIEDIVGTGHRFPSEAEIGPRKEVVIETRAAGLWVDRQAGDC